MGILSLLCHAGTLLAWSNALRASFRTDLYFNWAQDLPPYRNLYRYRRTKYLCTYIITEYLRYIGRRSVVVDHLFNVRLQGRGLTYAAGTGEGGEGRGWCREDRFKRKGGGGSRVRKNRERLHT